LTIKELRSDRDKYRMTLAEKINRESPEIIKYIDNKPAGTIHKFMSSANNSTVSNIKNNTEDGNFLYKNIKNNINKLYKDVEDTDFSTFENIKDEILSALKDIDSYGEPNDKN
jgi:gas vesicle protein